MKRSLEGKTIVLGVCASIAAYKAPDLVSALTKAGAEVHVCLSSSATDFVAPLALEIVSKHRVWMGSNEREHAGQVTHIELAKTADAFLLAPASANELAKLAHGLASDMLGDFYLAASCPCFLAPAMNERMYAHPATKANLQCLLDRGAHLIEPVSGNLACGDSGKGKMAPLELIVATLEDYFASQKPTTVKDLEGLRLLVTAGPTREAIDPVRFLSNHSTGKMGYAVAEAARQRGASVTLISGPVHLTAHPAIELVSVRSAKEMKEAVHRYFGEADVLVMAAAVADYRPKQVAEQKIKKSTDLSLELEKTEDILLSLVPMKQKQLVCGFAMETEALLEQARAKLEKKQLDLICANDLGVEGAGFGVDTNVLHLVTKTELESLPLMSKLEGAHRVLDKLMEIKNQHI